MSLKPLFAALPMAASVFAFAAHADIVSEKGIGTISIDHKKPTPAEYSAVMHQAEENALDQYIAEYDGAKQRIYDAARPQIMNQLDKVVLNVTVLTENYDKVAKTYTVTVRADINQNVLDNLMGGNTAAPSNGPDIALIFMSRSRSSVQKFDDRVYQRTDTQSAAGCKTSESVKTKEGESVRHHSVGTTGSATTDSSYDCNTKDVTDTGGSTTSKADHVEWTVAEAADFDQQITGDMTDSGYNLVPAEYVNQIDLNAIRADYSRGTDLAPQTLRSMVAAVKAAGLSYVVLGTMDVGMPAVDPVTGNRRIFVSINARLLDLTGAYPRPVAAIGPIQYSGLGPDDQVALTQATKSAADDVAKTLIDHLSVKGVH